MPSHLSSYAASLDSMTPYGLQGVRNSIDHPYHGHRSSYGQRNDRYVHGGQRTHYDHDAASQRPPKKKSTKNSRNNSSSPQTKPQCNTRNEPLQRPRNQREQPGTSRLAQISRSVGYKDLSVLERLKFSPSEGVTAFNDVSKHKNTRTTKQYDNQNTPGSWSSGTTDPFCNEDTPRDYHTETIDSTKYIIQSTSDNNRE